MPEPQYTRGIKADLDAYPGTRAFTVRDRQGTRIFHCSMPEGMPEDSLLEFLEAWLNEADPSLRLLPSDRRIS